ncbi:hypothetical protein [Myroides odoratus]|uniref:Uncharacterized protein n=1 Tax=Myroides odoratus TaxID=256 RepID=A0A9Q6ZCZ8_MYROD|nr:hypothetical protein [Myroides odoratus]EHQ43035.1 hypothetical protein Myrod_2209 [Myroides odoratus DSM 2801]EKB06761.1 hypothetical protein HMPREF9716_02071 [Myroides odoratus CIP 103059]QQU00381.1 hypothetical protein I6I88_01005 [Myroides odoratus]WQD57386.1 hypothetical protein U0010_18025 [Myroides odoratus]STZ30304.1 Uncharacterised protein [Myroides odoratus]
MTTKIQFKLSNDILLTVIQMVEKTDDYVVQSIKDALLVSIKEDLLAKLEDKAKNIQKQVSILDHNKKHAIVLKYHEAYTMYKLLELVYEKETFADHPHIKKIKRLLVDLENKVESFTTENNPSDIAQTATPVLASFPRLGVNEIIIEEATILEGEINEDMQALIQEEEANPTLDPSIDINEIVVKNYSIFDLLEENQPVDTLAEETASKALEVIAEPVIALDEIPQEEEEPTRIEEESTDVFVQATQVEEQKEQELTIEEETSLETEKITAPLLETSTEEPVSEEDVVEENEEIVQAETIAEIETTKEEEVPFWAQQAPPPVFDGIVTKTSICIESEEATTACTSEEETLNLFEEATLPLQPLEEKVEKEVKKEKRKPAKDNTQQGQISLF